MIWRSTSAEQAAWWEEMRAARQLLSLSSRGSCVSTSASVDGDVSDSNEC